MCYVLYWLAVFCFVLNGAFQVEHHMSHRDDEVILWARLSDPDLRVVELITRDSERHQRVRAKVWRCSYCRDRPHDVGQMTYVEVISHLRRWYVLEPLPCGQTTNVR